MNRKKKTKFRPTYNIHYALDVLQSMRISGAKDIDLLRKFHELAEGVPKPPAWKQLCPEELDLVESMSLQELADRTEGLIEKYGSDTPIKLVPQHDGNPNNCWVEAQIFTSE